MAYIDVRIEFSEEEEHFAGKSYLHHTPVSAQVVATDLTEENLSAIGESAFQSDRYTVGVANAVLAALDGRGSVAVTY